MKKAILALIVTLVIGCIGIAIGHDIMNGFPELGSIIATAVMGAFIIYFNDKKK